MALATDLRKLLRKTYGEEAVPVDLHSLAYMPYGIGAQCLSLNLALGRPGFPAGRLTEIAALEHRGKSTLCYHVLAECQRLKGQAFLLETEQAFDVQRLQTLGVDTKELITLHPLVLEETFEMMARIMRTIREDQKFTGPVVLVWDSVAGTPSAAEYEGGFDEAHMAVAARIISNSLRKLVRIVARHKVVLIFINQLKSSMARWGDQYTAYGGMSIGYHASIRVRLSTKAGDIKRKGDVPIGTLITADTVKNKIATPFQKTSYYLDFAKGIDPYDDLWRAAVKLKVLRPKTGGQAIFTLGDKSIKVSNAEWPDFLLHNFKTTGKLFDLLTQIAIEQHLISPYGM